MVKIILVCIISYLIGSIPFGYLAVKLKAGKDIRKTGSGSTGATNVARNLGKVYFLITTLLDSSKGAIAVVIAHFVTGEALGSIPTVAAGIIAILGHIFPIWLKFKGGKGVNTALGVALVLCPFGAIGSIIVFIIVFLPTRIVSISSISAGFAFALTLIPRSMFFEQEMPTGLYVFGLFLPIIFLFTHRENIKRLIKGNENSW